MITAGVYGLLFCFFCHIVFFFTLSVSLSLVSLDLLLGVVLCLVYLRWLCQNIAIDYIGQLEDAFCYFSKLSINIGIKHLALDIRSLSIMIKYVHASKHRSVRQVSLPPIDPQLPSNRFSEAMRFIHMLLYN